MKGCRTLLLVSTILVISMPVYAERLSVPGSNVEFESSIQVTTERGASIPMRCTGTALRERFFVKVNAYALGSYVLEDAILDSAEDLATAKVAKALHIVVERSYRGKLIAKVFTEAIRANYPNGMFTRELLAFRQYFRRGRVRRGDSVWFLYVPGSGLTCRMPRQRPLRIASDDFARAIWDMYVGLRPIRAQIKSRLLERL